MGHECSLSIIWVVLALLEIKAEMLKAWDPGRDLLLGNGISRRH
jgi:hypothetical protein